MRHNSTAHFSLIVREDCYM